MAKISQRVLSCKKNFMKLHNEGKSIKEIAEKYNISQYSLYKLLQDIADENNVSRDSLLVVIHKKHSNKLPSSFPPSIKSIDASKVSTQIHEMKSKASKLITTIETLLNESEDNLCQD